MLLIIDIRKNRVEAEAYEVEIFDEEKYRNFRLKYLNLIKRSTEISDKNIEI